MKNGSLKIGVGTLIGIIIGVITTLLSLQTYTEAQIVKEIENCRPMKVMEQRIQNIEFNIKNLCKAEGVDYIE